MSWLMTAMQEESSLSMSGGVKDFLHQMVDMMAMTRHKAPDGFEYATAYEYFLKNGNKFESSPLSEVELGALKRAIKGHNLKYKPKECFYNAQALAQDNPKVHYVEGYCFSGLIPFEHAWNAINGKVIDFTMAHSNGGKPILGEIPSGWEYFGVEFPTRMVRGLWSRTGYSTPLVSNYGEEFPLLKGNQKKDDRKKEEPKKEPEVVNTDSQNQEDAQAI